MWVALEDQGRQVIERLLGPSWGYAFELDQTAQRLRDLDVEQVGNVEPLVRRKRSGPDLFRATGSQEQIKERRGINDDQRLSRSARTISVGDALPL